MHPLLLAHAGPKGLPERKRPHSIGQIKKHSTMSLHTMPSLFCWGRLWVTQGHFLHVCVHLLSSQCISNNSDKGPMLHVPAALHETQRLILMNELHHCAGWLHVRRWTCSLISDVSEQIPALTINLLFH